ncbi:MAG: sigma-70 family RNA polymerase sigma factor [Pseudomonadota bacterium]
MTTGKQGAVPRNGKRWEVCMAAIARERDKDSFGELFDHFGPRIKSYLRRLGASDVLAEDLMQEVMLTLWRRADQFDARKAAVSTWVFTIARNKRIDALRRQKRPEVDMGDPATAPDPEDDAPKPDEQVNAGQLADILRAAIGELPPEQAQLLNMAFYDDKSHTMIADELDLPLGTVKSRLRLALKKLRTGLGDVG